MKKILILNSSHAEIPLIESAKKMNFYTIVTGNNPELIGKKYADKYVKADYSSKDEILKIAINNEIDYIIPCCNDMSIFTAQYVAEKMNLNQNFDNVENLKIIHHKNIFRKFCNDNNIVSPKSITVNKGDCFDYTAIFNDWDFPLLVKPIDMSGGKGISKIYNVDEIININKYIDIAFKSSNENQIIIEEFIDGENHGFSAIVVDKKIRFYFHDDEYRYINPYLVSAASTPSSVEFEILNKLKYDCEKIINELNLVDGLFHVQYILKHNNMPQIIEITRRPPGDLYLELVNISTNVEYVDCIIKAYINESIDYLTHNEPKNFYIRHCVMSKKNGIINKINIDKKIQNNIVFSLYLDYQSMVVDDYMKYKYAIFIIKLDYKHYENVEICNNMNELIYLDVSDE